jgi:hypothetical protein
LVVRIVDLWLISRMGPETITFALNTGVQAFVAAVILGLACSVVGAVIVARRPGNAIGWLYVGVGFGQAFLTAGLAYAGLVLPNRTDDLALTLTWLNGIADFAAPVAAVAFILALYRAEAPKRLATGPERSSTDGVGLLRPVTRHGMRIPATCR